MTTPSFKPAAVPRVTASTPLRSSEDRKKVEKALKTVFPDAELLDDGGRLVASTESLKAFRDLIWKSKILDAARRILLNSLSQDGSSARFLLNKQAACAGTLSFAVGQAPLGDIEVDVEGEDLEATFKEIAPPTLRGRPVSEGEFERHLERQRKLKAVRPRPAAPEVDVAQELSAIHRPKGDEEE